MKVNILAGTMPTGWEETVQRLMNLEKEIREISELANLDVMVTCGPRHNKMFTVWADNKSEAESNGADNFVVFSAWKDDGDDGFVATANIHEIEKGDK